jgi:hypothetical protein
MQVKNSAWRRFRFANEESFCYHGTMTQTPLNTETSKEEKKLLSIQSEEEFHDKIEAVRENEKKHVNGGSYDALVRDLHDKLRAQDSDAALSLMTR